MREVPAWIHAVLPATKRYDALLRFNHTSLHLARDVVCTRATATLVHLRNDQLLFRLLERRHLHPRSHFGTARRRPKPPLGRLRSAQDMHVEIVGRDVRGMTCSEALIAIRTSELHHTRKDRMHRQRRPERRLTQGDVVLGHAEFNHFHWQDVRLRRYLASGCPIQHVVPLPLSRTCWCLHPSHINPPTLS